MLRTDHELVDQQGDLRTTMTVRFRAERRLDVNVPVEMVEEYTRIVRAQGPYTRCRARYSNFRRFEVESRIVMPP